MTLLLAPIALIGILVILFGELWALIIFGVLLAFYVAVAVGDGADE